MRSYLALIGLFITGITLFGVSYLLMPEATQYYFAYLQSISSTLVTHPAFPIWNAHGFQTFWIGIFPGLPWLGKLLYSITTIVGLIRFWFFYQENKNSKKLLCAIAIILTVWCTPYLMIYDWAILLIPASILWREYPAFKQEWRVIYAILWITMFVSGAITALMRQWLGWSVQASIPVFVLSIYLGLFCLNQAYPNVSLPNHSHFQGRENITTVLSE